MKRTILNPGSIFGIPVVPHRLTPRGNPKFKLNPDLDLSVDFQIKFNDWARQFFGVDPCVYCMNDSFTGHKKILVHPDNLRFLDEWIKQADLEKRF